MGWFDSEDAKVRKMHVYNLMTLAAVDGHIDENKHKLLTDLAIRWGLKPEEFLESFKQNIERDLVIKKIVSMN